MSTCSFYLLTFLLSAVLSWDGLWIGLNDIAADNFFVWSDGQTVTYTNWNVNEPNDFSNRNEDCVEMRLDVRYFSFKMF